MSVGKSYDILQIYFKLLWQERRQVNGEALALKIEREFRRNIPGIMVFRNLILMKQVKQGEEYLTIHCLIYPLLVEEQRLLEIEMKLRFR